MVYDAIQASLEAHKDQFRKLENGAYVAHPLEVAIILAQNGADEDVISAGILHDTIEDTSMTSEFLLSKFGERIAAIVVGCSEPSMDLGWRERKDWMIHHLHNTATQDMLWVICADKLSNMRSIARNYRSHGDSVWQGFHAPYTWQMWYYTAMLEGLRPLAHTCMFQELEALILEVFHKKT
jgi:(p)ppGpp synthase/HD superfamily hydrolase